MLERRLFCTRPPKPTEYHSDHSSSQVVAYLTQSSSGRSDGAGIAYFYCDFTRSELQCAKNVIGSLVAQLCSQFQHPEKLLLAYRDSLTPGKRRRPSWDVLKDTILWFSKERKILILSDALDECEKREEILEFFCKLSKEQGNISVFVTSREEADIEVTFQSYPRLRMENRRVEVDRDIQSCIDQRLATDANLKNLPLTVKTDIKLSLMEKCAGMYVSSALVQVLTHCIGSAGLSASSTRCLTCAQ